MKLLVENGASINTRDEHGATPFQNAVIEKHMEIMAFLMENEADLKLKTRHFKYDSIEIALKQDGIDIVKKLLYK